MTRSELQLLTRSLQDVAIARRVVSEGRALMVVANKWDKIKRYEVRSPRS